jgi:predicted nucleic acid-binding protein
VILCIANTSTLSNFAAVGQLELLKARFETLYISEQVVDEIQDGLIQGYDFYTNLDQQIFPFSDTGWLHFITLETVDELMTFNRLLSTLHTGEASCLSIAHHRQWLFLSDDKAARQQARAMNVPISGTLGVLLSLVKQNQLPLVEADTVLWQMIQKGYYSPVISLSEID